jgi:5'(3')-deoxyribonucleotidase
MIFLDMDGVLADFDKALADRGIVNDHSFLHKHPSEWTEHDKALDAQVVACMNEPGWFYNLDTMPGASDLWHWATVLGTAAPYVLTARPKEEKIAERVTNEKRNWIRERFPLEESNFICCVRSQKSHFAVTWGRDMVEHKNILVDDLPANIAEWQKAGGIGILFTSAEQAIQELRIVTERS